MLAACVVLLGVGVALLVRGLVGRRVGEEPRCRRCGYIVHGIESGQCPECGLALVPGAVRAGVRVRRWRALGLGCVLLLIGAGLGVAVGTGWAARTNFYQYLPTGWVVKAAGRGSADAMTIVEKRVIADEVKGAQLREVIETGLAVHGAERSDVNTQRWVDLLAQIEKHVGMTKEQSERFCSQMFRLEVFAPPRVVSGGHFNAELRPITRIPSTEYFALDANVKFTSDALRDDFPAMPTRFLVMGTSYGRFSPAYSSGWLFVPARRVSPGVYEAKFDVDVRVRPGRGMAYPLRRKGLARQHHLKVKLEVVPEDMAELVAVLSDSYSLAGVRAALDIRATVSATRRGRPGELKIEWRLVRESPCDASLELAWRPKPQGLAKYFAAPPTIAIPQGRTYDQFQMLDTYSRHNVRPGDILRFRLRSLEHFGYQAIGSARLKPDVELEPIDVVVEAGSGWPTSGPAIAAGAGGT